MPIAKNAAAISAATCPASIGPRSFPARAADSQGRPYRAPGYGLPGRQLSIIGCRRFAGFRAVKYRPDPSQAVCVSGLGAMPGWLVVMVSGRRVWQVLLLDNALGEVMRVLVALAMSQPRGPAVARIPQMGRHRTGMA